MTARALHDFFGLRATDDPAFWQLHVTQSICNASGTLWGGVGLGAAMEAVERCTGRATVWAAVQYIRPIKPGDRLDLTVQIGRSGRRLTQAQVLGRVSGEVAVSCLASLGPVAGTSGGQPADAPDGPDGTGASDEPWRAGVQFVRMPADVPPPERCPVRRVPEEMAAAAALTDHFEQRWALPPRVAPYDATPGTGRTRLWLRFAEPVLDEERTGAALAVLADLAPSAISEAVGVVAGGVSLDNTIRIARPWVDTGAVPGEGPAAAAGSDGGWTLLDVTVESVLGDVAQLSARVFDPAGGLLAVAGQSAMLRRFPLVA